MISKKFSYLLLLTLTATFGGLLFGYDTAVISGTVESLKEFFVEPFAWAETRANAWHGMVVSSALIGCIIGGLSGGLISLHLGRRKGLLLAALLFLISALGSAMPEMFIRPVGQADHSFVYLFVVYRIIGGVGVGLASMLSPLYIAEIAPSHLRGRLVSWNQFAIVFGMLVVYFVNYSIALRGDDGWLNRVGWRWMFASEVIPASLFAILLIFIPETPRYYVLKGNHEKALKVLTNINGPQKARVILEQIKSTLQQPGKAGKLFSFGKAVIIIGLVLAIFQQFVGINVVIYYAPVIFRDMGAKTDASLLSTIYIGAVNITFTVIAIITVDRIGRKSIMIPGALVMATAMGALGFTFFFSLQETTTGGQTISQFNSEGAAYAALVMILVYCAGFSMSWGPIAWVLLSEIFPNRIRGRAMALATATIWISNLIISSSFPVLNNNSYLVGKFNHGASYWIYGIMGILAAIFVSRFIPETKQKTLEELQQYWKK